MSQVPSAEETAASVPAMQPEESIPPDLSDEEAVKKDVWLEALANAEQTATDSLVDEEALAQQMEAAADGVMKEPVEGDTVTGAPDAPSAAELEIDYSGVTRADISPEEWCQCNGITIKDYTPGWYRSFRGASGIKRSAREHTDPIGETEFIERASQCKIESDGALPPAQPVSSPE